MTVPKKKGWPKGKPRKPPEATPEVVPAKSAVIAKPAPQVGTVYLLAKFDERFDHIDRRLRKIMATNAELATQVQKLSVANTAQTALIKAEHDEVMAKLDEIAATGSVDQAVLDSLKAETDKVLANNDEIKKISDVPAQPTP